MSALMNGGVRLSPRARPVFGAILILGMCTGALWFVSTQRFLSGDLINNLWGPTHLLVRGESAYDTSVLPPTGDVSWLPPVWLPTVVGALFPLGWLTPYQASQLWLVASICALVATIWLAGKKRRPPPVLFGLIALSVFLFPPLLSHLMLGQFTVLATLALLLAARLVLVPNYLLAGLLVAVTLSKPQIAVLVLPGLFITVGKRFRAKGLLSFAGALVFWSVLLTLPLWVADSRWIGDLISAQGQNPTWAQPSAFGLLRSHWGAFGLLWWGLLAVVVFAANIWLWLKRPPQQAVVWSLALTALVTPYVWSWDFVLLIPLGVYAVSRYRTIIARWVLALGYLLCWSVTVWIRFNTDSSDYRFWWIPWVSLGFVAIAYALDRDRPRAGRFSRSERPANST